MWSLEGPLYPIYILNFKTTEKKVKPYLKQSIATQVCSMNPILINKSSSNIVSYITRVNMTVTNHLP